MGYILNIETATKNCSVALAKNGETILCKEMAEQGFSHAEKLHLFIEEIIKEGKNVTQIFMEYSQIISLILLLNTPTFFELIKEHSTISISVTVFRSFYYFGVLHIVFPLSIPSCNTHRVPNTNTLKSYFQLKFWGSYLLSAFATILCFELYFDIEGIHPSS